MSIGFFSPPRANRAVDGWKQRSLRSMLSARSERNRSELPLLTVARERGVFVRSADDANHNAIPEDLSNYKVARSGDLVINKMKAWQGSLGLAPVDGIVSPAYFVFSVDFAVPEFGEYLLRSKPYVAKLAAASDGVRIGQWDLDIARMREIQVSLPAAEEQAAIVKYLAHANARIDNAIAAKRRLIALLVEQHEAKHAEVLEHSGQLQRLSTLIWEGPTNGVSPEISERGDLRTFSLSAVRDGVVDVRTTDVKWVERSSVRNPANYSLRKDDILLVRGNGNLRLVGRAGLVAEDMSDQIYPDLLMRVRVRATVLPRFLVSAINSPIVRRQIESIARTAVGTFKLSGADLRGIQVPMPTLTQQERAVREIDDIDATHARTVKKVSREVRLLEEFRTRLVADVVTGQVDVRAIAATLPDAPEAAAVTGDLAAELVDVEGEIEVGA